MRKKSGILKFFLALFFCINLHNSDLLFAQSPGANVSLNAPFEPINRIFVGVERGIGYGDLNLTNFNGIRSIFDFVSYKFDLAVGISEYEDGDNALSLNAVISKNLNEEDIDKVEQFSIFSGFGFTQIPLIGSQDVDHFNIPFGLCLGLDGPLPFIDINFALSFRGQYRIYSSDIFEDEIGFGINVGSSFFPSGRNIGVKINYDLLNIAAEENRITETSLSLGVLYIMY